MASIAAFVYFWSSAYEVSGGCATDTLYPSLLRMPATASQPEPSAKAPCTRTTFSMCCFMTILLCNEDPLGSSDFRCRSPLHLTALVLRAAGPQVCSGGRLSGSSAGHCLEHDNQHLSINDGLRAIRCPLSKAAMICLTAPSIFGMGKLSKPS